MMLITFAICSSLLFAVLLSPEASAHLPGELPAIGTQLLWFAIIHIVLFALYYAAWFLLFYMVYLLIARFVHDFFQFYIHCPFIYFNYDSVQSLDGYCLLRLADPMVPLPILEVLNSNFQYSFHQDQVEFFIEPGQSYFFLGEYVFHGVIAVVLFIAAGWIANRKLEV